jgi:hypothetical protein
MRHFTKRNWQSDTMPKLFVNSIVHRLAPIICALLPATLLPAPPSLRVFDPERQFFGRYRRAGNRGSFRRASCKKAVQQCRKFRRGMLDRAGRVRCPKNF